MAVRTKLRERQEKHMAKFMPFWTLFRPQRFRHVWWRCQHTCQVDSSGRGCSPGLSCLGHWTSKGLHSLHRGRHGSQLLPRGQETLRLMAGKLMSWDPRMEKQVLSKCTRTPTRWLEVITKHFLNGLPLVITPAIVFTQVAIVPGLWCAGLMSRAV